MNQEGLSSEDAEKRIKEINANKKYFCQECGKESPLNKWKESNQNYMNSQIRARKYIKMGKIDKNTPSREIRDTIRHVGKYKKDSKKDNMFIIRDLKEIKDELN